MGLALTDTRSTTWGRAPGALWRRSLDTVLVLGCNDGDPVELGGPAAVLWEVLDRATAAGDVVTALADLHHREPAEIEPVVVALLADLHERGLVARDPAETDRHDADLRHGEGMRPAVTADDPAAAIAGWGLPGCRLALPDPAIAWDGVLDSIKRERLSGLAVAAARAGALPLDDEQRADLSATHRDAMVVALRLERRLLDVQHALAAAGIDPLVLKGPALAHRYYADPSERPFGDIDLLVAADQLDGTFEVLAGLGLHRRHPEPRPGFDRRFGKGATFVGDDELEVDVHRTFASGPFGVTAEPADVLRAPDAFTVAGTTLRTLGGPETLVAVALHAVLGSRRSRLLNLRDVTALLAHVDTAHAIELASRWRADEVLAEAVRRSTATFQLDRDVPLVAWSASHVGPRAQRRALRVYTSRDRSYARQALAAARVVPGVRARAAYVTAMLLPDRTYVTPRDGTRARRWRRIVRTAVRAR